MNDATNLLATALRDFGAASGNLLTAWLKTLPPGFEDRLNRRVTDGAQIGVRYMVAATGRMPTLAVLLTGPDGEFQILGELTFRPGTLQ